MSQQNKNYKTEKTIDVIHDVKFKKITNEKEFNESFEYWNKNVYHSFSVEKQRNVIFIKKIKLLSYKKEPKEFFENLINSYMYSIDKKFNKELLSKKTFFKGENLFYKIFLINETKFNSVFIKDDVIYNDSFYLISNKKKTQYKIVIKKSMKAPFSLNITSLKSTTAKIDFKKRSKTYFKKIKEGIENVN